MSKYSFLLFFLVASSVYPVMLLMELLGRAYVGYILGGYTVSLFVVAYLFCRTFYSFCVTHMPMRYHLQETWGLYLVCIGVFFYYYTYHDQCKEMLCRDYLGAFWALEFSIPIWVNMFFLALECGNHREQRVLQLSMLVFLTLGGIAMMALLLNLLYAWI